MDVSKNFHDWCCECSSVINCDMSVVFSPMDQRKYDTIDKREMADLWNTEVFVTQWVFCWCCLFVSSVFVELTGLRS